MTGVATHRSPPRAAVPGKKCSSYYMISGHVEIRNEDSLFTIYPMMLPDFIGRSAGESGQHGETFFISAEKVARITGHDSLTTRKST